MVLAAETAIGKHPEETVIFIKKMITSFKKESKKEKQDCAQCFLEYYMIDLAIA